MFVISVTKTLGAFANSEVGRVISNLLDTRGKDLKDQLQLELWAWAGAFITVRLSTSI